MSLHLKALPSLSDNYIWLIINDADSSAIIIDPGRSEPCTRFLTQENINPIAILVTHRHWDHVEGIEKLVEVYDLPVYGPASENIPCRSKALEIGDRFKLPDFPLNFEVIDLSGHTEGHIGYLTDGMFFSGDTLFSSGCGRLLGGTALQLHNSLQRIKALPRDLTIYCTHEYTIDNLHFALKVEPDNEEIQLRLDEAKALRSNNQPTLPFTIDQEILYNPFLRTDRQSIKNAVAQHSGQDIETSEDCFRYLRLWKDGF